MQIYKNSVILLDDCAINSWLTVFFIDLYDIANRFFVFSPYKHDKVAYERCNNSWFIGKDVGTSYG